MYVNCIFDVVYHSFIINITYYIIYYYFLRIKSFSRTIELLRRQKFYFNFFFYIEQLQRE